MLPKLVHVTTVLTALSGMAVHELLQHLLLLSSVHPSLTCDSKWELDEHVSTAAHISVPVQGPFVGLHSWPHAHAHPVCFLALLSPSSSL